ncbi:MAG: hypothetical protein LLG05_13385 [Porphyromonadaceae bacterium]|nr:hypothetical protein [Porphyromonadaceae bacterium]
MAETFRRGKIIDILKRLMWKQEMIRQESLDPDYRAMKQNLLGQMQALDLVIKELIKEFGITEDEMK